MIFRCRWACNHLPCNTSLMRPFQLWGFALATEVASLIFIQVKFCAVSLQSNVFNSTREPVIRHRLHIHPPLHSPWRSGSLRLQNVEHDCRTRNYYYMADVKSFAKIKMRFPAPFRRIMYKLLVKTTRGAIVQMIHWLHKMFSALIGSIHRAMSQYWTTLLFNPARRCT